MSKLTTGQELGRAICVLLGEDPNRVAGVDIHIKVGEVPRITVSRLMLADYESPIADALGRTRWKVPTGEEVTFEVDDGDHPR